MGWIFFIIVLICIGIFIGTVTINRGECSWVKVKLRVNNDIQAGWLQMKPGKGIEFFTLDKKPISQKKNRISVIEPCLESSVNNSIPEP